MHLLVDPCSITVHIFIVESGLRESILTNDDWCLSSSNRRLEIVHVDIDLSGSVLGGWEELLPIA